MTTTTSYGTWNNHGDRWHSTVEDTVSNTLDGGAPEWRERMHSSGAFAQICSEYRAQIEEALPPDVSLCGNEFYGPSDDTEKSWEGELDISSLIEDIDLEAIVEKHNIDLV